MSGDRKIGFWSIFGAVLSAVGLIEFFSWVFSGHYVSDYIAGDSSPLVLAIADHISNMTSVQFYVVVALVVAVLSVIIAVTLVYYLYERGDRT